MSGKNLGDVCGIALRTAVRGPMREVSEVRAVEGAGLEGDVAATQQRGVTFLSAHQWESVSQEVGRLLPWHTRRANLLVDADALAPWIGQTVRLGDVVVRIHAETEPCGLMDEILPGLRAALVPECRGGVYGEILTGGIVSVGMPIVAEQEAA